MKIDKKTYMIGEENRYKTQIAKTQIILGASLRKDSYHITRLEHKDFGKTKKWNTYTISRSGKVYQHYDPKNHTDFLGIKEADKKSISILLENMGSLFLTPDKKYINWLGEECNIDNIAEKSWLGYSYWEKFTDKQIDSVITLCDELCDSFGIPKSFIEFHHYHKDTVKYRGIVFRSNYIEDSNDINPFFEIGKFNEMLHNKFV